MANEEHGSKAVIKIANAGDVLTKVSGGSSTSLEESIDTAEVTEFEDGAKRYIAGLEDANLSLEASYTPAGVEHLRGIKKQLKAFEYYPAGEGLGEEKLTGELLITSISRASDVNEKVTLSAAFQVSGGVTGETLA